MNNKKSGKILDNLFEELDRIENSNVELDQKLEEIGIDSEKLVKKGLKRINDILGKHTLESRMKWTGITAQPATARASAMRMNSLLE